jgi:hypothetical protein
LTSFTVLAVDAAILPPPPPRNEREAVSVDVDAAALGLGFAGAAQDVGFIYDDGVGIWASDEDPTVAMGVSGWV